jgi:hypothetical protein
MRRRTDLLANLLEILRRGDENRVEGEDRLRQKTRDLRTKSFASGGQCYDRHFRLFWPTSPTKIGDKNVLEIFR